MKRVILVLALAFVLALVLAPAPAAAEEYTDACWGQATAAYAQTGAMGEHASQEETPRVGLANLARQLYEAGQIEEPTLQALGAWLVSIDPDLTVEACGE